MQSCRCQRSMIWDWSIRIQPTKTDVSGNDCVCSMYLRFNLRRFTLEESKYIQDGRLIIKCVLTVVKEPQVSKTIRHHKIEVPLSDIIQHLAKMLEAKEGADVTFSVGSETFEAHRNLLAMRSPVFKPDLYGPMMEARIPCVTIKDMQPAVFRALLHFIYTDSLPDLGDLEGDDNREMIRHLLVAADRKRRKKFGALFFRMVEVCQNILAKNLDVETMATTMALVDQHNCGSLKDACIEFISFSDEIDAVVATKGIMSNAQALSVGLRCVAKFADWCGTPCLVIAYQSACGWAGPHQRSLMLVYYKFMCLFQFSNCINGIPLSV